jgi:hypothetical protein
VANVAVSPVTIVALFEDRIDAEDALLAMRRAQEQPDQVSLLIRSSSNAEDQQISTEILARALVNTALDAVGGWLQGLTSVIVPERGTYLVAGPLGAALAGIAVKHDTPAHHPDLPAPQGGEAISLLHTFVEFGFGNDEASYLEHRLAAGAVVVALTSDQRVRLQSSRRLFADYNAVHIGQARTDAVLAAEASALLAAAPEASQGGDVIVADAVATVRHLCATVQELPEFRGICGSEVIDSTGRGTGVVYDLLGEDSPAGESIVRYVVVAFGGLLGLGRHFVAVPRDLVDLAVRPVKTRIDRETVQRSPRFEPNGPFSRRLETAICEYFQVTPYWE